MTLKKPETHRVRGFLKATTEASAEFALLDFGRGDLPPRGSFTELQRWSNGGGGPLPVVGQPGQATGGTSGGPADDASGDVSTVDVERR